MAENPVLVEWTGRFGLPPFAAITDADFEPAFAAALTGAASDRLTAVTSRLAVLGTRFRQNLLAEERVWCIELSETDLEGLPEFVVASARAAGAEKGLGPVVTLSR